MFPSIAMYKKLFNFWTQLNVSIFAVYLISTIYLSYLPNPSARAGYDTRSIFKRSLTGFNSEFSFS